jgi:hypothetical protein
MVWIKQLLQGSLTVHEEHRQLFVDLRAYLVYYQVCNALTLLH